MTKVVDDDKARQASPGRPILYVLVASLMLAGVYLVTMMGWSGHESPPGPVERSAPSASSPNSGHVPAGNPAYPAPASPQTGTQGDRPAQ